MMSPPAGPNQQPPSGQVSPLTALTFATMLFVALVVGGQGILTAVTAQDIIAAPGFGELAGAVGVTLAAIAFALVLWSGVRRPAPTFWTGAWTMASAFLGYLFGVALAGAVHTSDIMLALGVSGRLITTGFALVVAAAGLISGWGGIFLICSRGGRPRWPWERDDTP